MSSTPMTKPQQPDGALADNLTHTTLQHGPSSSPGRQIGAAQARAGAVPQTAVTPAVTRRYSSGLLNFAAHSPEGGQRDRKSHSARLWRTDRTDCSSTERRLRARTQGDCRLPPATILARALAKRCLGGPALSESNPSH